MILGYNYVAYAGTNPYCYAGHNNSAGRGGVPTAAHDDQLEQRDLDLRQIRGAHCFPLVPENIMQPWCS